jgi:4-amino-4-deoxy-L-arabinose transferase-like glycosyltransferase
MAGLAHLAFLLGLAHLLTRPVLLFSLAAIHLAGFRAWGEAFGWLREIPRRRLLSIVAALVILGLPLFLLALYPPTDFDATLYHLPDARAFARAGALPFLAQLRFPVFPQLDEALFAAILLLAGLAGDITVHLAQLLAMLLTAALLVAWGERARSSATGGTGWLGWLAAAAYLGSPIVIHLGTTAYVEAGLTLFTTAALYALWRHLRGDPGERGWLVLSAVFAASAAGVKYLGLFFLAAAGLAVAWRAFRRRRAAELLLFSAVALTVLLPVYGRILYYTGNPIFPYLPRLFGHSPWDAVTLRPPAASFALAVRQGLGTLATLPWNVVFARARTGSQPPFSPLLLFAVPLLAYAAFRDRRVRLPLLLALAYAACFPLLPPDARYLLPLVPLLGLALAAALDRPWLSRWGAALAVLLLLPGLLYAGYRVVRQGAPPVTAAARDRYLTARLPLYPAVAWLNRERGSAYTVYACYAEDMTYFAEGTLRGDWHGPGRFLEVLTAWSQPEILWGRLRALGAGYLLVPRGRGGLIASEIPGWTRWFERVYADPYAEVFALRERSSSGR